MGPPASRGVSRAPRYSGASTTLFIIITGLSPSTVSLSKLFIMIRVQILMSTTPSRRMVWATSAFARRYLRNRFFFIFLWLLRCFSLPGSLPCPIHSGMDDTRSAGFPHSEIPGSKLVYQLPWAYRRFPRLSSPLDAKTSTAYP